MLESGRSAAR